MWEKTKMQLSINNILSIEVFIYKHYSFVSERSQNIELSKLSDTLKKDPHWRSQVPNQAPGTTNQWYLLQAHI